MIDWIIRTKSIGVSGSDAVLRQKPASATFVPPVAHVVEVHLGEKQKRAFPAGAVVAIEWKVVGASRQRSPGIVLVCPRHILSDIRQRDDVGRSIYMSIINRCAD